MKLTVKKYVLYRLASAAAAVVPSREIRPELGCFLVTVAAPGSLRVVATDLDLTVVASSSSLTAEGSAQFLVPATRLLAILKEVPDSADVSLEVTGHRAKLSAGQGTWELVLLDALDRYPQIPDMSQLTFADVDRRDLAVALKTVRYAASKDGARPGLACVSIVREADGSAKVSACDSARFQQARMDAFPFTAQIPAIGTPSAVDELLKVLAANPDIQTVKAAEHGNTLVFQVGSVVFATGKLMARPTEYESQLLTPALANGNELLVSNEDLRAAIRRVRINADTESRAIGLRLAPNLLTVFTSDRNHNEASETLTADWRGSERTLVVHHEFLTELLTACAAPQCRFLLGTDAARKKSLVLLRDDKAQTAGVIQQLHRNAMGKA